MGTPLKHPPVYFTVAQARFNALLNLSEYLPSIQDSLRRAGFPDYTAQKSVVLQIVQDESGQATPLPVAHESYVFGNADRTHSFILSQDRLTLQSTNYGQFELFSEKFLKGLAILHDVVTLDFTERVGLRYLDRVVPRAGDSMGRYLAPEVLGLSERLDGTPLHSYSETFIAFGAVKLRARAVLQAGPLAFPPDLLLGNLVVQERFTTHDGAHAILDNDGFIEQRETYSQDTVAQHLSEIHGVIDKAFHVTAMPYAFDVWNSP
ncbi:TIGR04255 family protein [Variovorax sp. Varisp85]|uniref:TIGR04255 family protein n=1 Tax=Variovorax sp. Varisp85 TaxID=3243059 RepID=UPI0039A53765